MTKHRFTLSERYALWQGFDKHCFYCGRPLDFNETTVDHVVPEHLMSNAEELARVTREYGLDTDIPNFEINDFSNWVPADIYCNTHRKGEGILPLNTTLLYLHQIQKRLPRVREEFERQLNKQQKGRILGRLATALENNEISREDVLRILEERDEGQTRGDAVVIAFGFAFNQEFPLDQFDQSYPAVCDMLEEDLLNMLRTISPHDFEYSEPSARNGETLTVRLVFPEFTLDTINELSLDGLQTIAPWEILEVSNFHGIYGLTYREAYPL